MGFIPRKNLNLFARNFVFGVEDSLVSTVGLISGIAVTSEDKFLVILTGFILIFVEAFSMGIGSFLSQRVIDERTRKSDEGPTIIAAIIMFVSYMLAGFIPLAPYILFTKDFAFVLSIGFSGLALFLLGYYSAKILKIDPVRNGFRMLILGGVAIALGIIVGTLVESWQGVLSARYP